MVAASYKRSIFASRRTLGIGILLAPGAAFAGLIDFEGLSHGDVVTDQFASSHGVTISAENISRDFDHAVAFDSNASGTADPDLEGPWGGGNLASDTHLGNLLILQENNTGTSDGVADSPDDEGGRPAGSLFFEFAGPIISFGFDLVDVEGVGDEDEPGSVVFSRDGTELGTIDFLDFVARDSAVFGNNSANRIAPIGAVDLGGSYSYFDRVEIRLGGSGAVDNIRYTRVPGPATLLLAGAGLALLGFQMRRTIA